MEMTLLKTRTYLKKVIDYDVADFKRWRDQLNADGFDIISNKPIKKEKNRATIIAEKEVQE